MSEEEKTHAQLIEDIISRKMKPIYWFIVLISSVFLTISVPMSAALIDTVRQQSKDISSDEAYRNFLPKLYYHQLQKDEHISDIEAIRHPADAETIYLRHNSREAEQLEIRMRGSEK